MSSVISDAGEILQRLDSARVTIVRRRILNQLSLAAVATNRLLWVNSSLSLLYHLGGWFRPEADVAMDMYVYWNGLETPVKTLPCGLSSQLRPLAARQYHRFYDGHVGANDRRQIC